MASSSGKTRETRECLFCGATLRTQQTECKSCGRPPARPAEWEAPRRFVALVAAVFFVLLAYWAAVPNMRANAAISMVRAKESDFIDKALDVIKTNQYRFIGWETRVWGRELVLVTFNYQDPRSSGGIMAIWWAVNLENGTATRVKSMADFADNHLLKLADV